MEQAADPFKIVNAIKTDWFQLKEPDMTMLIDLLKGVVILGIAILIYIKLGCMNNQPTRKYKDYKSRSEE